MDIVKKFEEIMKGGKNIALASCTATNPHVRIVDYYYDAAARKLYFATFADNNKVKEFETNSRGAFTTIPNEFGENIRVKTATVTKANISPADASYMFRPNNPEFDDMAKSGQLIIYEVRFTEAFVLVPPKMEYDRVLC